YAAFLRLSDERPFFIILERDPDKLMRREWINLQLTEDSVDCRIAGLLGGSFKIGDYALQLCLELGRYNSRHLLSDNGKVLAFGPAFLRLGLPLFAVFGRRHIVEHGNGND